jgi:hypothetical protein
LTGCSGRLKIDAANTSIQLVGSSNAILHSVLLSDFTGNVNIKGSPQNDSLVFDSGLSGLSSLKTVTFDGQLGADSATVEGNLSTHGDDFLLTAETITVNGGVIVSTQSVSAAASDAVWEISRSAERQLRSASARSC